MGDKPEVWQPIKSGGRPRGSKGAKKGIDSVPTARPPPRPEVICWKEQWSWIVGIELPDDLEGAAVTQNGQLLEQETTSESRYRLSDASTGVRVAWAHGDEAAGGERMFWFTTLDHATWEYILSQPIWRVASREGDHTLIEVRES